MSLSKWGNSQIKEPFVILAILWWHIHTLFRWFNSVFPISFLLSGISFLDLHNHLKWDWQLSLQNLWVLWTFSKHTYSIKTYCTVTTFLYTTLLKEIINLIKPIAKQHIWTSKHFVYFPVSGLSRTIMEIIKPSIISRVSSSIFYLSVDIL